MGLHLSRSQNRILILKGENKTRSLKMLKIYLERLSILSVQLIKNEEVVKKQLEDQTCEIYKKMYSVSNEELINNYRKKENMIFRKYNSQTRFDLIRDENEINIFEKNQKIKIQETAELKEILDDLKNKHGKCRENIKSLTRDLNFYSKRVQKMYNFLSVK
jgi:hypothetical protein